MEALAYKIANIISLRFGYEKSKEAVVAYGLIAIIQMTGILVLILIFGLLFGIWAECLILFWGVGLLRKSTGGAHASTMENCMIISVMSIVLLSFAASSLPIENISITLLLSISTLVFILYFFIAYLKVPVDSPNKPIVKPEKIARLRRQCYLTLSIYLAISSSLIVISGAYPRLLSFAAAVHFSVLWQMTTLTKLGAKALGSADKALIYVFKHQ